MFFLDQFIFLYAKLMMFFYITTINFNLFFKSSIQNYLLIDIVHQVVAKNLYSLRFLEASFFDFFILNCGTFFMYYQLYYLVCLLNYLSRVKTKNYLFLFLTIVIVNIIKLILKFYSFFVNNMNMIDLYTLNQSRLLFIIMFFIFLFYIFIYVIPAVNDFYLYIKNYYVNYKYQILIQFLFIIFFFKLGFEIFQVGFLDLGKFLMNKNILFNVTMRLDSDNLFILICLSTILLYVYLIYFLKKVYCIIKDNYNWSNYYDTVDCSNLSLDIGKNKVADVLLCDKSVGAFLIDNLLYNIGIEYNIELDKIKIISHDTKYGDLFDVNSELYNFILKNKIIYYDIFFDLKEAYYIYDIPEFSDEKNNINAILETLNRFSIKIIISIFNNNCIENFLVIFNTKSLIKKKFYLKDLGYFINCTKYIMYFENIFGERFLHSKFLYLQKISEFNYIESNKQYKNIYDDMNRNINCIHQGFVYENKKNIQYYFDNNFDNIDYFKSLHKNKDLSDDLSNVSEKNIYIDKNKYMTVLSSNKINIEKYNFSFYTILPSVKVKNGLLEYVINKNRINDIFPIYCDYLNPYMVFFNFIESNFFIKIIIYNQYNCIVFRNIMQYVYSEVNIYYISFGNISTNHENIFDLIDKIYSLDTKVLIWITDIKKNTIDFQNKILYYFINKFIHANKIFVKLALFVKSNNQISWVSKEFVAIAKIIEKKDMIVSNILISDLLIILKNYSLYILKKDYSVKLIEDILVFMYQLYQPISLYYFINYFFKVIDYYIIKKKYNIDDQDKYIFQAIELGKNAMQNVYLMNQIGSLYNFNYSKIAYLLQVHKSTISRYYNKINLN